MKRILFFLLLLVNLQLTTDNGSLNIGLGEVSAQSMKAEAYNGRDGSGLYILCYNCGCMISADVFDTHQKTCRGTYIAGERCALCGATIEECSCEDGFVVIGHYQASNPIVNYGGTNDVPTSNSWNSNILDVSIKDDRGGSGGNWGNSGNGNQNDRDWNRDDNYDRDRTDSEMICKICRLPISKCICPRNADDDRGGGSTDNSGDSQNNKNSQVEQKLASTGKEIFTKMETDLRKGNFKTVKVSIVAERSVDAQKAKVLSTISNACLVPGTIDATVGAMQYFKYGTAIANNPFYAGIAKTFGIFGIPVAMGQTILICAEKGSWGNMTLGEKLTIFSGGLCAVGVCLDCAAVVIPPLAAVGTGFQIVGVGLGIASLFVSDAPLLIPLKNGKYLLMTPVYNIS